MEELNHFEQDALIAFINERPVGNLLRDIAERRLIDLRNSLDKYVSVVKPKKQCPRAKFVINLKTGEVFPSILEASLSINITRSALSYDLSKEKYFKYPFRLAI